MCQCLMVCFISLPVQVVDELTEQFGLVTTSPNGGTKKQSLNHLLNFHYAPRSEKSLSSSYGRVNSGGNGSHYYNSGARWLMSTQKHKYNKEQFLQAKYVCGRDRQYIFTILILVRDNFYSHIVVISLVVSGDCYCYYHHILWQHVRVFIYCCQLQSI